MATTYKVLGQSLPLATATTTLYTVPAATSTVCSTLAICNQGVSTTYRVAVSPAGATLEAKHYVVYESVLNQYDTVFLTLGITLAATDIVRIYSGTATVSFSLFGSEIA